MSDDLNNDFGGVLHLADVHTPHLDRLSRQGVRFEQAHCQYPLCNPSRVSLLSGLYPTTTQVLDNITPPRYAITDYVTLPQHLRRYGYNAAYVGKVFHLLDPASWENDAPPPARVKDHHFNFWMEPVGPEDKQIAGMLRSFMEPQTGHPEALEDFRIADQAIGLMNKFHDEAAPFFLAVGFRRPHVPFIAPDSAYRMYAPAKIELPQDFSVSPAWKGVPPEAFRSNLDLFFERNATPEKAREMIAAYYGCVTFVDWQVGRLLAELDRLGIADNTIVSVIADHGWHLGQKGMWAKMTLFENSTRVPLILYDPRKKGSGRRCHAVVESIDLYPTLVELCGLPAPKHVHGRSLAGLVENPDEPWHRPAVTVMLRHNLLAKSIRTAHWRYTEWDEGRSGLELYDHDRDPSELENLAADPRYSAERADLARQLHARLQIGTADGSQVEAGSADFRIQESPRPFSLHQ